MTYWTKIALTILAVIALGGCNKHLKQTISDGNNNNGGGDTCTVEVMSRVAVASWVEFSSGNYGFGPVKVRDPAVDDDYVGFAIQLTSPGVFTATGQDNLLIKADCEIELHRVPADKVGQFEMLLRNIWMLPVGWQPNLQPQSLHEAEGLEIETSAVICAQEVDLTNLGCSGMIPSSLFSPVPAFTSFMEWNNTGTIMVVYGVRR